MGRTVVLTGVLIMSGEVNMRDEGGVWVVKGQVKYVTCEQVRE